MIIAIDFDGTIVEHKYPRIGKEMPFAFEVMQELQAHGHKLILWTYRDGEDLKNAVNFCKERGLTFFSVNNSRPDEEYDPYISRKIYADVYIDDRNLGGFVGWEKVREMLLIQPPVIDGSGTGNPLAQPQDTSPAYRQAPQKTAKPPLFKSFLSLFSA